ncbi:hypothetical protein ATPR_2883 [Acetobacter tropicalis NBRC 101654]|uniref:Uncharacterized protein n=1 Tax=Acetobacter tropicalis NBRC 101654 TaxID=749388 RepID=F7VHN4_9PROT|nr:hypothetical protein ATPR_2883 [Acetobacter tropicalis NBRC 101654]
MADDSISRLLDNPEKGLFPKFFCLLAKTDQKTREKKSMVVISNLLPAGP